MIQQQLSIDQPGAVLPFETYNVILLHGLFGKLSNWKHVSDGLSQFHNILVPELPLFDISLTESRLDSLVSFLKKYIDSRNLENVVLVGNSLGGHIALLYVLRYPGKIKKLVLTGSSGLYENSFNNTFPRVKDYNYIKERVNYTFYNKKVVTEKLLSEVFETVRNPAKTLSIISLARAAQRHNLSTSLSEINIPVQLIWGLQDQITPPSVAVRFKELIPGAELHFIDQCGHAPMMEQPALFNKYLNQFLIKQYGI